jgi:hypothetical protein
MFFFEKKNQKTFALGGVDTAGASARRSKRYFAARRLC